MAQFNGEFDATQVEPSAPMEVLPDNWYPMMIAASKWEPTKANDGTYLELELQVIDGPYKGRKAWDRLNLANKSEQAVEIAQRTLSAICHATGVLKLADSMQVHGIPMLVKVTVKQGTNGPMNEVKGYKKLDGAIAAATPAGTHAGFAPAGPATSAAPVAPAAPATPPWAAKKAS